MFLDFRYLFLSTSEILTTGHVTIQKEHVVQLGFHTTHVNRHVQYQVWPEKNVAMNDSIRGGIKIKYLLSQDMS